MFGFCREKGIAENVIIEKTTTVSGNKNSIETKNESSLNFYINGKSFVLKSENTKIIDDGDLIKVLCSKQLFNKYVVLAVKNITKNRDNYSKSLFLTIMKLIWTFVIILVVGFILSCINSSNQGTLTAIFAILLIFMFIIAFFIIMATIFMKNNKEWLLKED